jgi:hypothetical protein
VPVKVWIRNNPYFTIEHQDNTQERIEWSKDLYDLKLVLSSEPRGKLAYVQGSAILQGGRLVVIEKEGAPEMDPYQVQFELSKPTQSLEVSSEDDKDHWSGAWILDMLLVVNTASSLDATFTLHVDAPCAASLEQVGCHDPSGFQRVSESIRALPLGGTYPQTEDPKVPAPVLGCSCLSKITSASGYGLFGAWGWMAWLLGWILRQYRRYGERKRS